MMSPTEAAQPIVTAALICPQVAAFRVNARVRLVQKREVGDQEPYVFLDQGAAVA